MNFEFVVSGKVHTFIVNHPTEENVRNALFAEYPDAELIVYTCECEDDCKCKDGVYVKMPDRYEVPLNIVRRQRGYRSYIPVDSYTFLFDTIP